MKKFVKVLAIMAAFAVLTMGVSAAVKVEVDGSEVKFVLTEAIEAGGSIGGKVVVELGDGITDAIEEGKAAQMVYNPANGVIVFAGVTVRGLAEGALIGILDIEGEGTVTIIGESGIFEDFEAEVEVVDEAKPPIVDPKYCSACGELEDECTCGDVTTPPGGGNEKPTFDLDSITAEILEKMSIADLHALAEQLGIKSDGLSADKLMDLIADALGLDGWNPKAGVALAIVPAIVAAAAVVVARKRK